MPPNPEPDSTLRFELTAIGEIVERHWRTLLERFPMVSLGEYVIIPNHVYSVAFINKRDQSGLASVCWRSYKSYTIIGLIRREDLRLHPFSRFL